jgi:hypothetical protein
VRRLGRRSTNFVRALNIADEIADDLDVSFRNFNAGKFIFDQHHQLELIEPVEAEIVTEVGLICD